MARKRKGLPINGILLLDKPIGISSNKALQKIKYLYKAQKAGHTGSLDPLATGMLPICLGEATKTSHFLLNSDKSYQTTIQFGITTTTGDTEGEVIETRPVPTIDDATIQNLLTKFTGQLEQVPPMYSALKHQGQPLYKLARQGKEIERKARNITIFSNSLLEKNQNSITVAVDCSKGTYIRSLAMDMGEALGCGAHITMLRRVHVSPFNYGKMFTLDDAIEAETKGTLRDMLLPVDAGIIHFSKIMLDEVNVEKLMFGQTILAAHHLNTGAMVRIYNNNNDFLGIGEIDTSAHIKPKRLIQQPE
ncbi:MAG: tRNA pseudouridine synthase B (EC [uncultured Thiotrichaceae bacterium]|uniref:tRNA pseudouridine synthase B n=1 Tax=uncultured Thiotrichaceae bacterium TaxID=298394 RepID=A0A6S6SAS9_9GAMM|nr:MAG: tRNA pseudouridine synthase B (EC [uncultured Thiotrichaceae bacterium]